MYFVVAYDRKPGVDYGPIHTLLESYAEYWHLQQSLWIVGPVVSAEALATEIAHVLDQGDLLLVQQLTDESAWAGYTPEGTAWLSAHCG